LAERIEILGEMFTRVEFGETRYFELPCVYLIAHEQDGEHRIHYAGQTHSLKDRFSGHHQMKSSLAGGATHVLVLVIPAECDRRAFETMLRYEFRPPLNEEAAPTHIQAWRAAQHCRKEALAARARQAHLTGAATLSPARYAAPPKAGKAKLHFDRHI
jgi:predicted GIY-YIG superfamily endonuclease